jgi:hypothetical protein
MCDAIASLAGFFYIIQTDRGGWHHGFPRISAEEFDHEAMRRDGSIQELSSFGAR